MVLLSDISSSISSLSSDEQSEAENDYDDTGVVDEPPLPPSKRQKLGDGSRASSSAQIDPEPEQEPERDLDGDISSDTSGEVPGSPIHFKLDDDDFNEQVTVCAWDGCRAGDQGNMDKLVEHIHSEHIESRQKKYTCEWNNCLRKSMPHASGYALKAHMRSHTREKPFYCYLPECDRAFTRSDALAKHMRTVHETEALRPSDPVPKSAQNHGDGRKGNKLKIILKTPQSHSTGHDDTADDGDGNDELSADFFTPLTEQHGFTSRELALDVEPLWKLSAANLRWAMKEGESLRRECKALEAIYRQEWLEKEVLVDQVSQFEEDWWQRRKAVLAAEASMAQNGESGPEPADDVSAANHVVVKKEASASAKVLD
ncbi:zinc finger protein [Xylariomycetidae sp. FL0641]|nr:zinc finger protein [Xylariomycetidae sp. FL0641]